MSVFGGSQYISIGADLTVPNYISRVLVLNATTTGLTVTLPTPPALGAPQFYVYNAGSNAFTLSGLSVAANTLVTAIYGSSGWKALSRTGGVMVNSTVPDALGYSIGGFAGYGQTSPGSKVATYNYLGNSWAAQADNPALAGSQGAAAALGSDVYLMTPLAPSNTGAPFTQASKYTQITNTWAGIASYSAFKCHQAATISSNIFTMGAAFNAAGFPSSTNMTPNKYTVSSNTWAAYGGATPSYSSHPHFYGACSAHTSDDKAYLYGGLSVDTVGALSSLTNTLEIFDESAGWSSGTASSTSRLSMSVAQDSGVIYFAGGANLTAQNTYNFSNPLTTHESYTISTDTWATETALPSAAWGKGAFGTLGDNKIYHVGGFLAGLAYSTATADVQSYNPTGNTWDTAPTDYTLAAGVAQIGNSSVSGTV